MRTIRFAEVVRQSGRPHIHLTWSTPERDTVLTRAGKEHRVVTVHQQVRGARKDYAEAGIQAGPGTQFLIFPKSVRAFAEQRIVAIHYDLIDEGLLVAAAPGSKRAVFAEKKLAKAVPRPSECHRDDGKLIPFEPPATPPRPAEPAGEARDKIERDPTKVEIRAALQDLKAGHARKAAARLERLLR